MPSALFPSGFATKTLYAYLFYTHMPHALPILSSLTDHLHTSRLVESPDAPVLEMLKYHT